MPKPLSDLSDSDLEALRSGDYSKASSDALETWRDLLKSQEAEGATPGLIPQAVEAISAPVKFGQELGRKAVAEPDSTIGSAARAAGGAMASLIPEGAKKANEKLASFAAEKSAPAGRAAEKAVSAVDDFLMKHSGLDAFEKLGALSELGTNVMSRVALDATKEQLGKVGAPDIVQRASQDALAGAVGVAEGGFGALRMAGLERSGAMLAQASASLQRQAMPYDPSFADHVASGFGSMAVFLVPGYGVQAGAELLAPFSWRMANLLGVSASAVLESATEAGGVYNELLGRGESKDKALAMANADFFANLPLTAVTDHAGVMSIEARKILESIWKDALAEGSQEMAQQFVQAAVQGDPVLQEKMTPLGFKMTLPSEEILLSGAIGAVTGGAVGGVGHLVENRMSPSGTPAPEGAQPRSIPTLPPPPQPEAPVPGPEQAPPGPQMPPEPQGPIPAPPQAPGPVPAPPQAPQEPQAPPPPQETTGGPYGGPGEKWEDEMAEPERPDGTSQPVPAPSPDPQTSSDPVPGIPEKPPVGWLSDRWYTTLTQDPRREPLAILDVVGKDPSTGKAGVFQVKDGLEYRFYPRLMDGSDIPGTPENGFGTIGEAGAFAEKYVDGVAVTEQDPRDPAPQADPTPEPTPSPEAPHPSEEGGQAGPAEQTLSEGQIVRIRRKGESVHGIVKGFDEDGKPIIKEIAPEDVGFKQDPKVALSFKKGPRYFPGYSSEHFSIVYRTDLDPKTFQLAHKKTGLGILLDENAQAMSYYLALAKRLEHLDWDFSTKDTMPEGLAGAARDIIRAHKEEYQLWALYHQNEGLTSEEPGATVGEEGGQNGGEGSTERPGPGGPGGIREPGAPPLGGVPSGEGAGPAGIGGAPGGAEGGGGQDEGGNGGGGRPSGEEGAVPGPSPTGGVGAGEPEVHPSGPADTGAKSDYVIPLDADYGAGGKVRRFDDNFAAVQLLKKIEGEGRRATPEEQAILARYTGWGALAQEAFGYTSDRSWQERRSKLRELLNDEEYQAARATTLNAHYTSIGVVRSMWSILERMGFKGGRVLEPSMGTGNFFGAMPLAVRIASRLSGVEIDSLTYRIARQLYQSADVRHSPFEKVVIPQNFHDVAIGNVPFGNYPVFDKLFAKTGMTKAIHNYFFAKSLHVVRPGGLVVFITSRYTMDAKDSSVRSYLASQADLVGAIRLSSKAFDENAGTSVVTDILILRKKGEGLPPVPSVGEWVEATTLKAPDGSEIPYNPYFAANPRHILGRVEFERGMYRENEYTVVPTGDVTQQLSEIIKRLPEGIYQERKVAEPKPHEIIPAPGDLKDNGYTIRDGKAYQKVGGNLEERNVNVPQLQALLNLRDAIWEVFKTQLEDAGEQAENEARKKLNKLYDAYVKKYGNIRNAGRVMEGDPDFPMLRELEKVNPDTDEITKADIFDKRVMAPRKKMVKAATAKDALTAVLNELGRVDLDRMEALSGISHENLRNELRGLIFDNPEGGTETADDYLSGNVKKKLAIAKIAARMDPKYQENVKALTEVQPADLKPSEIDVELGAPWLAGSDLSDFAEHLTGVRGIKVEFVRETGTWVIDWGDTAAWRLKNSAGNTTRFGTRRMEAVAILKESLNGRPATVTDPHPEKENGRIINVKETELARAKQELMREEFKKWIWSNAERASRLSRYYNDTFNVYRTRQYNGEHLTFPGLSPAIKLMKHQINGAWRIIASKKNTLLAHVVGAGKTYTMVAAGMEMRRLGIARKPMYVVPKISLGQWEDAFRQAYPAAKVLVASEKDVEKGNRQRFMSRIATGDWDAVIVTHDSFALLPISTSFIRSYFNELVSEIQAAKEEANRRDGKRSPTVKDLEKMEKSLTAKMEALLAKYEKDQTVRFDELGVDHLFVDESHQYKNLLYVSSMTRVAGLGNKAGSGRAFDLYLKARYLNKLRGGRGVTFATGTPISNTIAEMYHLMRYLDEDSLRESGLATFDAWARTFGKTVTKSELAIEGGGKFVSKTRFARFQNAAELLRSYMEIADIKGAKDLQLPRPELKGGKGRILLAKKDADLEAYFRELVARAEAVRAGKVDPKKDNLLKIATDGRKAALDLRLVLPHAADNPQSKLNLTIAEVFKNWQESKKEGLTQLIFADLGTPSDKQAKGKELTDEVKEHLKQEEEGFGVYADIKRKLVSLGVPASEIAFIHEAKTKEQRKKLFAQFNAGKVRIMIGSSGKMATAANVQTRLKWLYHMDPPWRPDIVEQREGRILRQGNKNKEVEVVRAVAEGSFDAFMWQVLESKAGFLGQLDPGKLVGRASIEDVSELSMTYEEVKAAATGNPAIKERFDVENALRRLYFLKSGFESSRADTHRELAELPARAESYRQLNESFKKDVPTLTEAEKAEFSAKIDDKTYDKREEFGKEVKKRADEYVAAKKTGYHELGRIKGMPFGVLVLPHSVEIMVKMEMSYSGVVGESAIGLVQSIEHAIKPGTVEAKIRENEDRAKEIDKRIVELKKELEGGFDKQGEIEKLEKRKAELDVELGITKSDTNTSSEEGEDEGDDEEGGGSAEARVLPGTLDQDAARAAKAKGQKEDRGVFVSPVKVELGGMGLIRPIEMPELVKIVQEITGQLPQLNKRLRQVLGQFVYREGQAVGNVIQLKPSLFKDPILAAQVLAHELGHALDYFPDLTMKRGNVLGRVAGLRGHLKDVFGSITVNNKTLRKELMAVSEWWRPYDKKTAPDWFIAYRNGSDELYADALSVLFNTPGTLEKMAPNFYREFFKALDKKPAFKDLYFKIQDQLAGRGVDINETRHQDIVTMFQDAQKASELKAQRRKLSARDVRVRLRQELDDANYPVLEKVREAEARGVVVSADKDPYLSLQEADMVDDDVNLMLYRFNEKVTKPLSELELTLEDLGEVMFLQRVSTSAPGDRVELANPMGHTPKTAKDLLENRRKVLGDAKFNALLDAAGYLRQENFALAEEAARLGLYSKKVFDEKILPNRHAYAAFQVLDYVKDYVSAGIKKQIGTLKGINNPVLATLMKMTALHRALAEHKAKTDTLEFLKSNFQAEVKQVAPINPQDDFKQFRASDPTKGVIVVMVDGHPVGFEVDAYIAKVFEHGVDPAYHSLVLSTLRWLNNSLLHPLLIVYNPGYQAFNIVRDFKATWHNNPNATLSDVIRAYWNALPTAAKRASGIYDATMEAMLEDKAIGTPINDLYMDPSEDQYERILEKHHVVTGREGSKFVDRLKILKPIVAVLEGIRWVGEVAETVPKVADYNMRKAQGESGRKLGFNTRTYAGTPNIFVRGQYTQTANAIFIYSRALKEGLKRDSQVAIDPKTRSGFWFKVAMSELAPKALMLMASYGLLGDWWKEWWARVPEYDKTNYIIIPLGIRQGGNSGWQAVYARIPHDEFSRFVASVFWKSVSGIAKGGPDKLAQVFDVTANQLPGVTPALTIPGAWMDYLSGKNPYDRFRGRNVISDVEFKAGGWPVLKKMSWWTLNSVGLVRLSTYDPAKKSIFERTMEVAPILNRITRITDFGLEEEAKAGAALEEGKKAELYLDRSDAVRRLALEANRLAIHDKGGRLSDEGKHRLRVARSVQRNIVVPFERAMAKARDEGNVKKYQELRSRLDAAVKRSEGRWSHR